MIRPGTRPMIAGFIVASILFGVASISSARHAGAHAVLETSSPADQSVVEGSPSRVELTFNEAVGIGVGAIRVFDAAGERVDEGVASHGASSSRIGIALKAGLPTGSYAVSWRVTSTDAHPVHGGFVFSVHQTDTVADLDALIDQPSQPGWEITGAILRALAYLGSFVVVGAAVYLAFIRRGDSLAPRGAAILAGLAGVTVLAQVLQIPVAAALATGAGPNELFSPGVAEQVLGYGVAFTLAGVAGAVGLALLAVYRTGVIQRVAAVVGLVLLGAAYAASGHSRTRDPVLLTVILDAVHVAVGAIWVGGVAMLVWALWKRRSAPVPTDPTLVADEVVAFSRLAGFTLVAVGLAGVVLAVLEVGSLEGLFSTGYGRAVLAKVTLLGILAALGGFNRFRLVPGLQKRPDHPARWRYLRRTLLAEACAMVAVLGVTAVLVDAVPARTALASQAIYSTTAPLGDEPGAPTANLVIDPARTGPTALHLYLLDEQGRPDDRVESIEVALTQTELDIGPLTQELRRAGPGHYLVNGTLFTVPGDWTVQVRVRVDEFTERSTRIPVEIRR